MRALTVVGLSGSGTSLLVREPQTGEQFEVSAEELRHAATATRDRAAQLVAKQKESAMQPRLSPREIQSKIRLGASLDEVAAEAGCDVERVERFAYPVLMERSAIAERARRAYPVVEGSLSKRPVEDLARQTLNDRGHAESMRWDAFRTEGGSWVLRLIWNAGRSENAACWAYSAGGSGGTVTALDDAAAHLIDPTPRPLRTVPEQVEEPAAEVPLNPLVLQVEVPADSAVLIESVPLAAAAGSRPAPSARIEPTNLAMSTTSGAITASRTAGRIPQNNRVAAALANHAVPVGPSAMAPGASAQSASTPSAPAPDAGKLRAGTPTARTGTENTRAARQRPPMPSWEDVLLGVRSAGSEL